MKFPAAAAIRAPRISAIALVAAMLVVAGGALALAASNARAFGVESFFAGNCTVATCGEPGAPPPAESEFFTQAAGHPNFGISDFTLKTTEIKEGPFKGLFQPEGVIRDLRVDVPAGLSTNPEAIPMCSMKDFESTQVKEGVFLKSACEESTRIGTNYVTVLVEPVEGSHAFAKVPLEGAVYNLEQPEGLPSLFGIAIDLEPIFKAPVFAHTLIEGGVAWNSDYHEYFNIRNLSPKLPLIRSRLVYAGNAGTGGFLTNPSACNGPQTTTIHIESYEGEASTNHYTTPTGASGCSLVPFEPSITATPSTTKSDAADGASVELKVPQNQNPAELGSADLDTARVTLPEGMTINPAAAYNIEACTEEQAGLKVESSGERTTKPVTCPANSQIGSVAIEVPTLPAKSLSGPVYLGSPNGGSITGPPYTIYFNAESKRYGVAVRQKGLIEPNPTTGRLTAIFAENPQAPFNSLTMNITGNTAPGSVAPLANPLACGAASTETQLIPYTGGALAKSPFSVFTVDANGSGAACPAPLPFSLAQSTETQSTLAGAATSFKVTLTRPEGQQYLGQVKSVLPAGLLGAIPSVTLCDEAQANAGTCSSSSQIGTVNVTVGSGRPYPFSGVAYLTGPYNGAPYGMSIVVPAVAGPFNLGNVVTRATINVEPYTGRLVVTSTLPQIVKGIPLRLQQVVISINRQNFLTNPTNCSVLATESTLGGFIIPGLAGGATQSLATPFQVGECNKLTFKPSLSAISGSKTSRANGASIEVKVTQGAKQANIRQVTMQLPKQLPSRGSTLRKACLAAVFETGPPPGACSSGARVGGATVTTPDLPGTLSGPAYLVSHGGEAFPDLDLILRGDGVTIVLVGHTHVSTKGIITSNFESLPDAPITSATVNLPVGPQSLLAANGNLCREQSKLTAPTTIVGQNGTKITQKTKIAVRNCPVVIVSHRTTGTKALVTVKAPVAGRVSGSGSDLQFTTRHINKAGQLTIGVRLSQVGAEVLQKFGRLRLRVRVGFVPKKRHYPTSKAFATVTFRT